jgi:imidazolonepropionase-like amidohydrolase
MRAIDCGTLVDGVSDEPLSDGRVLVDEEGVVREVGPRESTPIPDGATVVDHSESVVVPGLIDAHVHIAGWRSMDPNDWVVQDPTLGAARATADLRALLAAGFTTVRDVGGRTGLGLRQAVAEGEIPGPRIFTSELGLSQTAGHEDIHYMPHDWVAADGTHLAVLADGVDECLKETRKRIRKGVDLIKIQTSGGVLSEKDEPHHPQYTAAEVRAITGEAHRVDLPVAAHAQHDAGIRLALENGVDTLKHGFVVDDETVELMLETDAVFVPTMWALREIVDRGEEFGVPEYGLRKAGEFADEHAASVRRCYEAGVPIALGTDNVGAEPLGPHGRSAEEAAIYVDEVGMSEMDAVRAATSVAARTVPDDSVGAVRPGKRADLVVLDGDPLADIRALSEVAAVYKGGEQVDV